jgi:hypothetical protein
VKTNRILDRKTPQVAAAVALIVAVLLLGDCQGATLSSGSGGSSDVRISFRVIGVEAPASASSVGAAAGPSFFILASAETLTVTMTPQDPALAAPSPRVVAISSAGSDPSVSVSFPDLAWGSYTVSAEAADSGGVTQFQASSVVEVGGDSTDVTLNLLPAVFDTTTIVSSPASFNLTTMAAGEMRVYAVPTNMLSPGGTVPAGYYRFSVSMSYSVCQVYAIDSSGTLLLAGATTAMYSIDVLGGTSIVVNSSTVYVGPCSTSAPSYLIFVNGGAGSPSVYLGLANN